RPGRVEEPWRSLRGLGEHLARGDRAGYAVPGTTLPLPTGDSEPDRRHTGALHGRRLLHGRTQGGQADRRSVSTQVVYRAMVGSIVGRGIPNCRSVVAESCRSVDRDVILTIS